MLRIRSLPLLGYLVTAPLLLAQVDTGTLTGVVRDNSGAFVPGARVVIRNIGTGRVQNFFTDSQGLYVTLPLRPGEYAVEVDAAGFQKAEKRVQLNVAQRAAVDFDLALGKLAQVIRVQDVPAVLQTETSTLSNLRNEQAVKTLPLNGRNFAQLIGLAAGVIPAQTQQVGNPITMKRGVTGYAVNGLRLEENNFLVDGINNNENHNGLGILIFPPLDAIEEFRVETSVADAQFGRGGGGTVNLTYKSGTKDLRGGLFEFLRNSALDAKNFFDRADEKIPPFKLNQFGGFLGGRLVPRSESKTFFFTDYEGTRVRQAQTLISTVPIVAFRQGDFSAAPQTIFDPLTTRSASGGGFQRDPFAGNQIRSERIDPVGQNILNLYPLPNLGTSIVNNFLSNPVRSTTGDAFDIKLDRTFSDHDSGFFRFSHSRFDLNEPSFLPAPAVGNGPGVPGPNSQPANQIVLSETHILAPSKVNETRFGFTRLNLKSFNADYGDNVSSQIGVPGANVPGDILTSGLNIFSIAGQRDLGDNGFSPAILVSENFQWNDNFHVVRGRHTLKMGGEFERRRYNAFQSDVLRGSMSFTTAYTSNPASPQGTGIGAADVLLGKPISGVIRFLSGTRGFRRSEVAFFFQDDFKATEKLTLNMGLRYENFIGWPWAEVNDRMFQFVPDAQDVARVGTNGIPPGSGIHGDINNFGPHLGLAYKLLSKTVLRAAYGLFYSAPQLDITRNLASNPPEFIVSAFSNSQFDFLGARGVSRGFDRPAAGTIDGAQLNAIDPNSRTPYTQQWNAALQQQLTPATVLTVSYVGTKGTKLEARPDINQPVPGTTPVSTRRPYPRFQNIFRSENSDNSIYHGLQVAGERHLARGFSFLMAFTYSHSIDEATGDFIGPQDVRHPQLERGSSGTDVRRRLVASWAYELPFKATNGFRYFLEGWQVNGILNLYDGLPFSVSSATNTLNIGSGTRADRLRSGDLPVALRSLQRWFDVDAFAPPGPQKFGNAARNILRGPATKQLDFSAFKNFYVRSDGSRKLQFRAEFFNLTNTPQFNNPNATIGAPGAGTITSAGSASTLQRTSRQIQVALKFYF